MPRHPETLLRSSGPLTLAALLAVCLLCLAAAGCGGSDKNDDDANDNPWAGSSSGSSTSSGDSGWGGSSSRDRDGDDDGGSSVDTDRERQQNDRRIEETLRKAERQFEDGEYDKALNRLEKAQDWKPHSDDVADRLEQLHARVDTFARAFADITPLGARDNYVKVVFHGGGTVVGFLLEEDERKGTLLIKRQIGGYETVNRNDRTFAELQYIDESKQRRELNQAYGRLEYEFSLIEEPSALQRFRFAQTAWRYGKSRDAHEQLAKAFEQDPDIYDTVRMEADPLWVDFRAASAMGDVDRAGKTLNQLGRRYPNAQLFKEARRELGQMETAERDRDIDPRVAEFIFRRIDREARDEAEKAGSDIAIAKSAGSELAREMQGNAGSLISAADRHLKLAERFDNESRPGEPDADLKLEKAVFHYRCAQDLLRKAADRGASDADLSGRLVQANKGLFWCRKRMPLH